MPKFKSIPTVITAVQFLDTLPECVEWDDSLYSWVVYNKLHNTYIEIKEGDWVRTDNPDDMYPIDQDYMLEKYVLMETENE